MKLQLILLASSWPLLATSGFAQGPLTADRCNPLTGDNVRLCCNAPNWRDIIQPGSLAICSRGQNAFPDDPDAVGSITRPDDDDDNTPPVNDGGNDDGGWPDEDGLGNPGNASHVGRAGEKNMANEGVDPGNSDFGTKGNSNGDATGNPSGN